MIIFSRGEFCQDGIGVSAHSPHFRFGTGFFEIVYYNGHMARHLDPHLERLWKSLEAFSIPYAKAPFEEVIHMLAGKNGLAGKPARADIIYPVEDFSKKAQPVVIIQPVEHEPDKTYTLAPYPRHHVSYLCAHRSLSHFHFLLAGRWAAEHGADDCLLTDHEGYVLEASGGALVFGADHSFHVPSSRAALKSVALARASKVVPVSEKAIRLRDLGAYRHAFLVGPTIGMKPVTAIGEFAFEPDFETANLASMKIL